MMTSESSIAPSDRDVDTLLDLPDVDFDAIVAEEVRGEAEAWIADALRHDDVLERWDESLHRLYTTIQAQLVGAKDRSDPESHSWRYRALRVQGATQARKREVRRLIRDRNVELAEARKGPSPFTQKQRKEIRRGATDRAVSRLIEAHREEYLAIFAEEEAVGHATEYEAYKRGGQKAVLELRQNSA